MATEAVEEPTPLKLSFEGRLKLQEFVFKAEDTQPSSAAMIRRSPRLSTPISATASPSRSPSTLSSRKRKAPAAPVSEPSTQPDSPSTPSTPNSSNKKQKKASRPKSGYAPPSTYAHLPYLPDALGPNLLVLFVGLNPGVQTAQTGHAYAHPSNLFWKLLYSSGVTPVACKAVEDKTMPERFALGLTNIVSRPSRNGAELRKEELDAGVSVLEEKARRWRPEAVCIVGKSIWESVWRVRHGKAIGKGEFRYGWQDERENMGVLKGGEGEGEVADGVIAVQGWKGARVFVATSTSGLAASLSPAEKQTIWRELGAWVEQRREEREVERDGER